MSTLTRLIRATRVLLSCAAIVSSASTLAQSQPTNASFESPAYGAAGRNALPTTATWTFAGTAGIERFSVNDIGTPNTGGLNGMQAAYLSSTGTVASLGKVSQDINFPAPGQYQLRFMAGRVGAANAIRVSVGGVVVDSDITPRVGGGTTTRQLESWWTMPFSVTAAGSLTVLFSATNTAATLAAGNVMWLDQVTLVALPAVLPNGSFETVGSGWTLAGGATNTALTTPGVSGGRALVSSGSSGFGYFATSAPLTVPAGVYSLSLRLARTDPNTSACTTAIQGTYPGAPSFPVIPAPRETELTPYTTASFALPAGTYSLRLNGQCPDYQSPVVYDSLVLNQAGSNIVNADFSTPYLGPPDPNNSFSPPWQNNPPGATWTFAETPPNSGTHGVGIQGNAVTYNSNFPRTEFGGGQFGNVWTNGTGSIRQNITLAPGVYVVATRAAYGSFKLSVNGVNQSTFMRGGILQNQSANGYRFIEVLSEPFTVTTASTVQLGFEGSRFSFQYPRIIRVSDASPPNPPPAVSLSLQVNNTAVTGPVAAGGSLVATATASDGNGLQKIRVLRNGVELAPISTAVPPASAASPLNVTVSPLTAGTYNYVAEATDHAGAVSTASQPLTVMQNATLINGSFENPPIGWGNAQYTPANSNWIMTGQSAIQGNVSVWGAPNAPDGIQTAVLQCNVGATPGSIAQDVLFTSATNIQVRYYWATRSTGGAQAIQLRVGGVNRALMGSTVNTAFTQYSSPTINVDAGLQRIELLATQCDANRSTFIDKVEIVVMNAPPTFSAFTVTPNGNQQAPVASVGLSATATDPDAGGYVASIEFLNNGASFSPPKVCTNSTTLPARPFACNLSWAANAGTAYVLSAKAVDDAGGITTTAATFPLFINRPPLISVTPPATDPIIAFPYTLKATASDPDLNLATVEFYARLGAGAPMLIASVTPPQSGADNATAIWACPSNTSTGAKYTIYAIAKDALGVFTQSANITNISVNNPGLQNCSFEEPSLATTPFSCMGAACTSPVWTFNANSGIVGNGAAATYCSSTNAAQGTQAGFLRGDSTTKGKFSQTFNFPTSGTYRLDFRALRNAVAAQNLVVRVGGTQIDPMAIAVPVAGYPAVQSSPTFGRASAGDALIEFETQGTAGTQLMCIDEIRIVKVPSPPSVSLAISGLVGADLNGEYYTASQTVTLTAVATDLDGAATLTTPTIVSRLNGTDTPVTMAPFGGSCTPVYAANTVTVTCTSVQLAGRVDAYSFVAKTTDATAQSAESLEAIPVKVDRPPTVNTPTLSKTTLRQGEAVNITFTPTDLDGDWLSATVSCSMAGNLNSVAVPVPSLTNGQLATASWNVLSTQPVGSYTCTVTVSDGRLPQSAISAASAGLQVTVNNGPTVTLTSPTAGQTITADSTGALVTLTAAVNNADLDTTSLVVFEYQTAAVTTWTALPSPPAATTPALLTGNTTSGTWRSTWLVQLSADTVYSFRACATDSFNIKTCTAGVNATVKKTPASLVFSPFTLGGQSTVSTVTSGTNAVLTLNATPACSSGDVLTVQVNGTSVFGPGPYASTTLVTNIPIVAAGTYQATATRTCASPVYSLTAPPVSLTVSAVTEPVLTDVETQSITDSLTANGEVAGAIPGSATVNPSGAVTYSIAVPVAPGTAGMQPSLALQYSSQGGRGIVGTGWSLSGFSTIHRCPASVVIDNFKGRVGFDGDDRYCMDGMRLISVGDLDGGDGTEYRTERDSYARIYSIGNSGTGPTSWTVETKSGQALTFAEPLYKSNATGTSSDSTRIKAWGITRAEDTVGNYMTFAYTVNHNKGWMLPLSISYTGNTGAATPPYATVDITYDSSTRSDSAVIYDGTGSYGEIPPLITAITSKVDGNISQQLNIDYESSPTTGRTRLLAVQICGSGASTADGRCLKKTTFAYNNAAVSASTPWLDTGALPFSVDLNQGRSILALDLNGDGKTELLQSNTYYSASIANGATACSQIGMCNFVGDNGLPTAMSSIISDLSSVNLGDFNGDGLTDFVTPFYTEATSSSLIRGRFLVCYGQPAGSSANFQCEIKLDWRDLVDCYTSSSGDVCSAAAGLKVRVGDFDGDGRTDLYDLLGGVVYFGDELGATTRLRYTPAWSCTAGCLDEGLALGDFDGDGRMDIAELTTPAATGLASWTVHLSRMRTTDNASTGTDAFVDVSTSGPRKHDYLPHIPDVNGDGLADMLAFDDQTAPGADLGQFAYQGCMSRGNGTFECSTWRGPPGGEFAPFGPSNLRYSSILFGDFNGDGRTDIAIADADGSMCNSLNQATFNCTIGQSIEGPKSWLICPSIPSASPDSPRGRFDCGAGTFGNVLSGNGWWKGGLRRKGCTAVDGSGACTTHSYDLVVAGDFNGDGRTGLAGGTPLFGNPHVTRPNIPDPVAKIPDMLASVTNGLGFTNSFTYKPITDSSVYTKYNSGNAYPVLNIQTAMYVAATASHDDGKDGQQTYTYSYEGLKGHVTGGGTLGFAKVKVTDGKSGVVTETEYDNTYPARGLVKATRKWNGTTQLNESTTDYVLVRPYSKLAIHSYLPVGSTEKSWDLNGAALPVTKTTSAYGVHGTAINSGAAWGTYYVGDVNTKYGCATGVEAKTYAWNAALTDAAQFTKTSTNTYDNSTVANALRLCRLRTAEVDSSQTVYSGETLSEKRKSRFEYNPTTGLLTKEVVQPDGAKELTLTTNYTHDSFGNRITAEVVGWKDATTSLESRISKTEYDSRGRFPTRTENAIGPSQEEAYTWDEKLGVQLTLTGPNGLTTTSKYDKLGRKVVEVRADETKSVMIYSSSVNTFGGLTVTSRSTGGGESSAESDNLGREKRKSVQITDNGTVRTSYVSTTYDARGRVSQVSRPYWSTGTPVYPCSRVYDNLDRVSSELCTNDDGTTTSTTTDYAYNNNGLQTRVSVTAITTTGASSTRTSIAEVDARGKSKKTTNTNSNTVEHAYDAAGNLTRTTRTAGADKMVTVIGYDLRGRKTSLSDPDTGTYQYTYNAFGELLTQTDAKFQTITSLYDKLGRVTQRTSGVDLTSNYTYDTCTKGIGKLCVVSASGTASPSGAANVVGHQRTLTYDNYGRLQSETTQIATNTTGIYGIGARTFTASTTFDAASRVKTITYPNEQFVTRQYDATGAWNKLVGSAGNTLWQGGGADAEARWLNWTLGNDLTTTTTFGAYTGRLSSLTTSGGVQNLTLSYDGFGNIKSRLDAANGYKQSNGTAETFTYDTLNQLTQANFLEGTQNITYDGFGRILTKTGVNAVAGTYTYYALTTNGSTTSNRVQSANNRGYTYDANGNVDTISSTLSTSAGQASGTITLSWTSFNQSMTLPVAAAQNTSASATGNAGGAITLKYGADNGRVMEQLPIDVSVSGANQTATRFVLHSGASLFYEEDLKADGSSEARAYLTGPLGVVAVHTTPSTGTPTLTYWHRDHLGSLTVTTNELGAVKERMRFDPWGKPMTPMGARNGSGDRGFTGHEHLAGGLIHMNGRIYDPVLGRFLSADIVVQMPNAITSYDRYGYVMNNPLIYTDPSGYFIAEILAIAAFLANAAPVIMTVATVAANVAIMTGHETAGMRIFFAGMFLASGGGLGGGFLSAIAGGFAMGGLQSGSLDGAIVGAATAGILQVLAPLVTGLITSLDGALNSALASNSFRFSAGSVAGCLGCGVPIDQVVVTGPRLLDDGNLYRILTATIPAGAAAASANGVQRIDGVSITARKWSPAVNELLEFAKLGTPFGSLLSCASGYEECGRVGWGFAVLGVLPGGGAASGAAKPAITFAEKQLQSKFKHAVDFGVTRQWGAGAAAEFKAAINAHISDPATIVINGTYRETQLATHFYNPNTGVAVIRDASGEFLSGWRLYASQVKDLLHNGNIR